MATAAIALGTLAASATVQHKVASKQAKRVEAQQEKLRGIETAVRGEEAARSRRQSIQKSLIAQAQIENVAAAGGTSGSSAEAVSSMDVAAQSGSNIHGVNTAVDTSRMITSQKEAIAKAQQPTLFESVVSGVAGGVGNASAYAAGQSLFT